MKYLNLFDNLVIVLEFDECMCLLVNLMNTGVCLSIYILLVTDALWLTSIY
jgi:hypothetical protein